MSLDHIRRGKFVLLIYGKAPKARWDPNSKSQSKVLIKDGKRDVFFKKRDVFFQKRDVLRERVPEVPSNFPCMIATHAQLVKCCENIGNFFWGNHETKRKFEKLPTAKSRLIATLKFVSFESSEKDRKK